MTSDWKEVYCEERQRPGYVLEDGRSPIKRIENTLRKPKARIPIDRKRKAA